MSWNTQIQCPNCGKAKLEFRLVQDVFEYESDQGPTRIEVDDVPARVCDACGEVFFGPEAILLRHNAVCRKLRLLTPEEIKTIREQLGLSQSQLADLTGIGVASISRWERGRLLQNRAYDNLLRLIQANRSNAEFLSRLGA